ncbi:GNAT family N-acetyltransferase [Clostridium tepidum]|jgi:ElaA protein|uniref:GNAT family N-acetyltransferase n=1 Tax=Clostridium tepidum TaxID=1962263 RepID=A0A1S9IBI5_9CLOT|nr:GNAT family N-acetyltransferase [Clostridium tepidum]MCR1933408.1 GNAT family N-acetyltransferase [Clostridium tepidum]MDU6878195.1 GNAT family N-acetyltransferase [Clostridium botulinum]OOO61508.1 GNAT family N-acetyltransferase [Clostridium tepidum]OOO67623.1 GNAT family N-acetyltransferase [Clostridium tepidum]
MECKIKKFNELTVEEIYEILKIRNEVFIVEQKCPYDDCDDKDKDAYHLFYMEEGKVIAYLRILEKGVSYNEISIGRVLVNKDYRRKGLARKIVLEAIGFIENNLKENVIRISAQHYLIDFYKSVGFTPVSKVYLEDNIPHIEMLYKK